MHTETHDHFKIDRPEEKIINEPNTFEKKQESIPLSDEETKKNLELLKMQRMDKLFDSLLDDDINATNYEQYKKNISELFILLNSYEDLTETLVIRKVTENELGNDIRIILYKFTIVLSIKFLLEQLNPEYKGSNILELTNNEVLDESYSSYLEEQFNEMCINNGKDPQEELENAKIEKAPEEVKLLNQVKIFTDKYFLKKHSD